MNRIDADPATSDRYCDGLSLQRCARCHVEFAVSELVQVDGIGQVCETCDDELIHGAVELTYEQQRTR